MNPNHPHYAGLGGGPNLNLLDNMLMAAGFQATDQPIVPRPAIVPQYTYAQDVSMHQQALNLGQVQTTAASSDPVHVIVYQQNEHQQQPISYKIPQLGTVVAQEQNFVVNDQGGQISRQQAATSLPNSRVSDVQNTITSQTTPRHVQSPAERRKDIVAQAMQEQKIFEENVPKMEPIVKQEPGVSGTDANVTSATDTKPLVTATKSSPATTNTQRRPYQRSSTYNRQQVMPRLSILDDEDDGLTCRLCLASYWYKAEIHEHLKTVHSISDPDKYDKEEKDKKMRRMREEQQRIMLAKKQREERERRIRGSSYGRGRGAPGTIKLTSPGARPSQTPGQRPSFQYRDGAFICDLCKESFSDGNDMVTHWKSHVKKQQADAAKSGRGRPRGRPPARGRGRPSFDDRGGDSSEEDSDSDSEQEIVSRKGKGGKGMPRWTAYLLWSTRKRRDVVVDHPDWSFAQIAKWISDEWKKIDAGEKDELQKEAEEMNELGIRKLPRDDDGLDPEKDTTDEDSDFEEGYRKKTKPIMLKIKKEKGAGEEGDTDSDESDWEPEADIQPPEREQTRSGRQRKRPSFFQEFESQENNLDSILEQFEREQAQEFGKPRIPKPEKPPGEKKPRKPRKRKQPHIDTQKLLDETAEVETLRSGRKRKVRRLMTHFMEGSDEDDKLGEGASSDDDDFEPPPEDEIEKIEENDDQIDVDDDEIDSEELDEEEEDDDIRLKFPYDMELPPKKRGRPIKKLLTDEEIEEATKAAIGGTKPAIEIIPIPKENGDGNSLVNQPDQAGNTESTENPQNSFENAEMSGVVEDPAVNPDDPEAEKEKGEGVVDQQFGGTEPPVEGEDQQFVGTEQPADGEEDGDLPDSKKTARKSAKTSVQENEGFKVKPPWVKETLSDSEGEEEAGGISEQVAIGDVNLDALETVHTNQSAGMENAPDASSFVDEGAGSAATGADQFQQSSMAENHVGVEAVSENTRDSEPVLQNPINGADGSAPQEETVPLTSVTPPSDQMELGSESAPTLSEEDLLTGPAHNLDDSQFKPDIVDPNLDDIFK